ncbi:MAG: YIP1 family protein [Nitrospirae bacterium]|nr:YIP1 family protein [Nitrospirota bacterium]
MGIIERVKNILLNPKEEWPVIAGEQATVAGLYTGYAIPLAAIPVVSSFIGMSFFGMTMPFGGHLGVSFSYLILWGFLSYVSSLVGVYIIALIVNALAPAFSAEKNLIQALKLAVYSSTPAWIAGALHIVPMLGILAIIGSLYGIYLIYLGLPHLMKVPGEKAVGYTVAVVLAAIVTYVIIGFIVGGLATMTMPGRMM